MKNRNVEPIKTLHDIRNIYDQVMAGELREEDKPDECRSICGLPSLSDG